MTACMVRSASLGPLSRETIRVPPFRFLLRLLAFRYSSTFYLLFRWRPSFLTLCGFSFSHPSSLTTSSRHDTIHDSLTTFFHSIQSNILDGVPRSFVGNVAQNISTRTQQLLTHFFSVCHEQRFKKTKSVSQKV